MDGRFAVGRSGISGNIRQHIKVNNDDNNNNYSQHWGQWGTAAIPASSSVLLLLLFFIFSYKDGKSSNAQVCCVCFCASCVRARQIFIPGKTFTIARLCWNICRCAHKWHDAVGKLVGLAYIWITLQSEWLHRRCQSRGELRVCLCSAVFLIAAVAAALSHVFYLAVNCKYAKERHSEKKD